MKGFRITFALAAIGSESRLSHPTALLVDQHFSPRGLIVDLMN